MVYVLGCLVLMFCFGFYMGLLCVVNAFCLLALEFICIFGWFCGYEYWMPMNHWLSDDCVLVFLVVSVCVYLECLYVSGFVLGAFGWVYGVRFDNLLDVVP